MPSINISGNAQSGRFLTPDEIGKSAMRTSALEGKSKARADSEAAATNKRAMDEEMRARRTEERDADRAAKDRMRFMMTASRAIEKMKDDALAGRIRKEEESMRKARTGIGAMSAVSGMRERYEAGEWRAVRAGMGTVNYARDMRDRYEQEQRNRTTRRITTGVAAGVSVLSGDFGPLGAIAGAGLGKAFGGVAGGIIGAEIGEHIAAAVKAVIMLPMARGAIMQSAMGLAGGAINFTMGTSAMGRAGGFSGPNLFQTWLNKESPEYQAMERFGITPERFTDIMGAYGIAPRSGEAARGIATELQRTVVSGRAFAGLDMNTGAGLARQGVSLGLAPNNAQGVQNYLDSGFADVMSTAVARGMDRAQILESMRGSLDMMARGGAAGISAGGLSDLYQTMMQSGTPAGRTGEAAASFAQGMSGVSKNVFGNNMQTVAQMSAITQNFNSLKNPADVRNYVGKAYYDDLMKKNPGYTTWLTSQITGAAGQGALGIALDIAQSQFMTGNPKRNAETALPFLTGITAGLPQARYKALEAAGAPPGTALPYLYGIEHSGPQSFFMKWNDPTGQNAYPMGLTPGQQRTLDHANNVSITPRRKKDGTYDYGPLDSGIKMFGKFGAASGINENFPAAALAAQGATAQALLSGSNYALNNLVPAAQDVSTLLYQAGAALSHFAEILGNNAGSGSGINWMPPPQ